MVFFIEKKLENQKDQGFHMRYHFFLYYGWFLQNLRKDFIGTNMHTTVYAQNTFKGLFIKKELCNGVSNREHSV